MHLARNVFGLLERTALSPFAERGAFDFAGRSQTYAALHDRSLRLANALAGLGVRPKDRVAVLLANGHEWPEVMFALSGLGAVCVPVNVLLRVPEVEHVLADSDSSLLIADAAAEEIVAQLTPSLPLVAVGGLVPPPGAVAHDYGGLIAGARSALPAPGPGLDDTSALFYTSGTTGRAKGAEHTHAGVLWNAFTQIPDFGLTAEDTYLVVPSLSWAAGFHDLVLSLAWIGGRSVLMPTGGVSVPRIAETAAHSGSTHMLLVPTLLKQLLADSDALATLRSSSLRWIISGAEPVPVSVIEAINEELPACSVVQGYGLSEFPTIVTALKPEEAITHAGSAGRPLSITSIAVRGDDDEIRHAGHGEVLIRSLATMKGYFRSPDATRQAFRHGWLHSGDVGVIDDQGYLTITGRKKDMIISGGLNVYPKEVEEAIYRLDGVAEAAVVGVPDERWGEVPIAIVVPSSPDLTAGAVEEACRACLATYKCPRVVILRTEPLPRNPSGKVLKRELRPWVASELGNPAPS